MDTELQRYEKQVKLLTDDLHYLWKVDAGLGSFLIDETDERFEDCPEIDHARALVLEAYTIIKDYQHIQLLWVEEQNK